ncbi:MULTISPECIES: hypothetical protein [Herbaspirillum]|jgi:hypothetical protein|uniref:hypothetical protein n=1 Tax=Herbaspirillum TaxID=963 RepID=UPI00148D9F5D|nr:MULTISPECIES: hypothetical protein [Herbaspirillum]MCP1571968.1 hypothetical protein [Herbaspirillum rubrisubalbicans]
MQSIEILMVIDLIQSLASPHYEADWRPIKMAHVYRMPNEGSRKQAGTPADGCRGHKKAAQNEPPETEAHCAAFLQKQQAQ